MPEILKHTGFPSPADDYIEQNLNLNKLLISRPAATYFVRFQGSPRFGVQKEDLLIVDKSLNPRFGKLVIEITENEFRLSKFSAKTKNLWGSVTSIIRNV